MESYDARIDYFPQKLHISYATGFKVEYHPNYKVVTVLNPWQNAKVTFQYILVQCGTPAPAGFEGAQIIEVPIKTLVSMSTTHLPHLEILGVSDKLIGFSNFRYVNSPVIVQRIKDNTNSVLKYTINSVVPPPFALSLVEGRTGCSQLW